MPSPVVGGNRTHNILMKDGPVNHLTNRPTGTNYTFDEEFGWGDNGVNP
jgi:hypothetical protein